jgi:acyl-coenzyme A synthetase/AMP-(fatty) acid ligase
VFADELPYTATGKLLRAQLSRQVQLGQGASVAGAGR